LFSIADQQEAKNATLQRFRDCDRDLSNRTGVASLCPDGRGQRLSGIYLELRADTLHHGPGAIRSELGACFSL
jgi:hypothetical protein